MSCNPDPKIKQNDFQGFPKNVFQMFRESLHKN